MAASTSVVFGFHAEEVSDLCVSGVSGSRLHLTHHELVLSGNVFHGDNIAGFLLLFLDNVVLDMCQVNLKFVFPVLLTSGRTNTLTFTVSISVVVSMSTESFLNVKLEFHFQTELYLTDSELTIFVVDFGCCCSFLIGVVDSLVESSLHFGESLVHAAADFDRVSIFLGFVHLEVFLGLTNHKELRVLEVFCSEFTIKFSLNLVCNVSLRLFFDVFILKEDSRRSISWDREDKIEIVVSICEEAAFPVSNSLFSTDKGMLLLLAIFHSVSFFSLTFIVEHVECDLLFSLERHIQPRDMDTTFTCSITHTDIHLSIDLFSR
jgi:hypothetical protein